MRVRTLPKIAVAGLTVAASACELLTDPVCTLEPVWGIEVTVQDSVTGAPSASGAELIVRDGVYADTAMGSGNGADPDRQVLRAAGERPGRYTVTVRKAGFLPWERTNVVVTANECHVRTVALAARLQRLP